MSLSHTKRTDLLLTHADRRTVAVAGTLVRLQQPSYTRGHLARVECRCIHALAGRWAILDLLNASPEILVIVDTNLVVAYRLSCTLVPSWHIRQMIRGRPPRTFDQAHRVSQSMLWRCAFDCPKAQQTRSAIGLSDVAPRHHRATGCRRRRHP